MRCSERENVDLWNWYRERYKEHKVILVGARLRRANLQKAKLEGANLQEADLQAANLQEAKLWRANIEGANFTSVIVRDALLGGNAIDTHTNFTAANIEEARMPPGLEAQLEYNIRRKHWQEWAKGVKVKQGLIPSWERRPPLWKRISAGLPVRAFWWASDYGTNSLRLLIVFLTLAITFAFIYACVPGLVANLSEDGPFRKWWHAFYFSVVTMTTLGFGDIKASRESIWGQSAVMLQVFLGYILLGAFITRFGIMFISKAPCPEVPRAKQDRWDRRLQAWNVYWSRKLLGRWLAPARKLRRKSTKTGAKAAPEP